MLEGTQTMSADPTRVDAVASCLAKFEYGEENVASSVRALWLERAQAAIEANDAWLAERGWKAVPRDLTWPMAEAGHHVANADRAVIAGANLGAIHAAYFDAAPSPEEPER